MFTALTPGIASDIRIGRLDLKALTVSSANGQQEYIPLGRNSAIFCASLCAQRPSCQASSVRVDVKGKGTCVLLTGDKPLEAPSTGGEEYVYIREW